MDDTAEAKQVCRAASNLVYPELDFGIKPCGSYTREDLLGVLSRIAFTQEFANTGAKTVQLDRSEPVDIASMARNSLAKSVLYHLRQLTAVAIGVQVDGVRDRLFQVLRSRRLLPSYVDIAIDLYEWRFYGSADTDHVLRTYPDRGTTRAYCFATLCIVAPNVRFTLATIPLAANGFRAKQEALRSLIIEARQTCRSDTSISTEVSTRFMSLRNWNSWRSTTVFVHGRVRE